MQIAPFTILMHRHLHFPHTFEYTVYIKAYTEIIHIHIKKYLDVCENHVNILFHCGKSRSLIKVCFLSIISFCVATLQQSGFIRYTATGGSWKGLSCPLHTTFYIFFLLPQSILHARRSVALLCALILHYFRTLPLCPVVSASCFICREGIHHQGTVQHSAAHLRNPSIHPFFPNCKLH